VESSTPWLRHLRLLRLLRCHEMQGWLFSKAVPKEQLEYLLASQTAPKETAAILVESVLGEGGYVVPPVSFMKGLREICDRHGIMLIFDEVQSGFGRTGKWFAFEHFHVVPDIITAAKGLASGMPLSGVFSRTDIMLKLDVGSVGGTYGGNAIACAAGAATIRAMREENMLENATERGLQLMTGLRKLQEACLKREVGTVVVFEGWDAAGKGGAIRRVTPKDELSIFEIGR